MAFLADSPSLSVSIWTKMIHTREEWTDFMSYLKIYVRHSELRTHARMITQIAELAGIRTVFYKRNKFLNEII